MGTNRQSYVDYQQRASEFSVGDSVYYSLDGQDHIGSVVAVYPAIGMIDVEYPDGSTRLPVEDVTRYESKDVIPPEAGHDNVPGGAGSVRVPGGPVKAATTSQELSHHANRVARAWVKKSLYWAGKDRKYRATSAEIAADKFSCPKCRDHEDPDQPVYLRPASYKRSEGQSERLLGCPECLFLIKRSDIIGHADYVDPNAPIDPLAKHRVAEQTINLLAEVA